jgi:hypothetical protein
VSLLLDSVGTRLARYLARPARSRTQVATTSPDRLAAVLEPGDVLLVEGNSRFSIAIKYLTQSTWSHAALYVGDALGATLAATENATLVEADIIEGVHAVELSAYAGLHTRICRPVGLPPQDRRRVIEYAIARIGDRYDVRHIVDLARYLFPTPPVPVRWRRRLLALGSGDPTRAICSTLIAQAFQSVRYPILPHVTLRKSDDPACIDCYDELLHIRHHSLFVPRDFDVSPYFQVVKPTIEGGFDYRTLKWIEETGTSAPLAHVE